MAFDTNNLELHIKRVACSSIRICYRSACDYPIVLGAGILLLFLHRLCPSLFAFLLSSSPVFLLTALLLGALLIYGEPGAPVIGEETLKDQQMLPLTSKISITECSIEEVKNVTVEAHSEKTTDSDEVYVAERASDDNKHATHCEEKNVACMAADTVLSEEVYVEEKTSNYNLHDTHCDGKNTTSMVTDSVICVESSNFAESNVIVEREEHVGVNSENVELQESESTPESGYSKVQNQYKVLNQYQLGEFTSSCWQPVMRQDPCSDSESDLTESSPDASMTDIIPMFDELHPPIDLGTGHPSLAVRDNLNSSSDDNEDEEEEEDVSSDEEGAEGQKDDGNNWKDVIGLNSLDMEKNSKLENLMELQRAKNILKFELDKRLMNLQAADATQKLEVSCFHVQVPSISTPRRNPFDPSNDSEEMIELPQIPDSAPSVFPPRNLFDLPFDQMVDHDSQLRETWTPRSYSLSTQHRKHRNLYGHHSTYLQHHNGIKLGRGEFSGKNACDSHSDYDAEQEGNNGKLFGSLEAHIGEEIKILSAAISDVGVLEVNYGMDEGDTNADFSDDINSFPSMKSVPSTLEVNDSVHAGSDQSILCSLSKVNNSEQHIVEADSIGEVNSLFKCRMEEVLMQSISEHSIGQPLTVKLEDEWSDPLSPDSWMHVIEAISVEELNSQFAQLNEEELTCAASDSTCHSESIQDRSSEALPAVNEDTSELPIEDGSRELLTAGDQQTAYSSELQVIEARSIEDINSFIKLHYEEAQKNDALEPLVQSIQKTTADQLSSDSEQPGYFSELHVAEASTVEDITAAFKKLHGEVEIHRASDPFIKLEDSSSSELHVVKARSVEEETSVAKQLDRESQMETISDSATHEPTVMKLEGKPNEPLTTDAELPVVEASSVEEMNSLFKRLEEEAHAQMPQRSEHKFGQDTGETASDVLVLEAKSNMPRPRDGEVELDPVELYAGLQVIEDKTLDDDLTVVLK